jgi:hypothetical protein
VYAAGKGGGERPPTTPNCHLPFLQWDNLLVGTFWLRRGALTQTEVAQKRALEKCHSINTINILKSPRSPHENDHLRGKSHPCVSVCKICDLFLRSGLINRRFIPTVLAESRCPPTEPTRPISPTVCAVGAAAKVAPRGDCLLRGVSARRGSSKTRGNFSKTLTEF